MSCWTQRESESSAASTSSMKAAVIRSLILSRNLEAFTSITGKTNHSICQVHRCRHLWVSCQVAKTAIIKASIKQYLQAINHTLPTQISKIARLLWPRVILMTARFNRTQEVLLSKVQERWWHLRHQEGLTSNLHWNLLGNWKHLILKKMSRMKIQIAWRKAIRILFTCNHTHLQKWY